MAGTEMIARVAASAQPAGTTQSAPAQKLDAEHLRLRKATHEMEGWFVGMLLKKMDDDASKGGIFGQGSDAQMYRQMFDEALGMEIGKQGAFGIADVLYRELAPDLGEGKK